MSAVPQHVKNSVKAANALIENSANANLESVEESEIAAAPSVKPEEPLNSPADIPPSTPPEPAVDPEIEPEIEPEKPDFEALFKKEEQRYKVLQGIVKRDLGEKDGTIKRLEEQLKEERSSAPSEPSASVSQLNSKISDLEKQISMLESQKDREAAPVSAEMNQLREIHGDEIASVYENQQKVISELSAQLSQVNSRLDQGEKATQEQSASQDKYSRIKSILKSKNIDFDTMNDDNGFNNYLDYLDPRFGISNRQALNEAWQAGDLPRAARFFEEYHEATASPSSSADNEQLLNNVSIEPTVSDPAASSEAFQPEVWSEAQIQKLYNDKHIAQRAGNQKELERLSALESRMMASLSQP